MLKLVFYYFKYLLIKEYFKWKQNKFNIFNLIINNYYKEKKYRYYIQL